MSPIHKAEAGFVIGCWVVLYVFWYLLALRTKRTAVRQSFLSSLGHRVPVAAGYLLLMTGWHRAALQRPLLPDAGWRGPIGALVVLAGLLFALWARNVLGGNWSSTVTLKREHTLVRSGPYGIVRNPIYTGILMMVAGTAIQIGEVRGLLAIALVFGGFWIKIRQEEVFLLRQFPHDFPAYRRQVAGLIPYFW